MKLFGSFYSNIDAFDFTQDYLRVRKSDAILQLLYLSTQTEYDPCPMWTEHSATYPDIHITVIPRPIKGHNLQCTDSYDTFKDEADYWNCDYAIFQLVNPANIAYFILDCPECHMPIIETVEELYDFLTSGIDDYIKKALAAQKKCQRFYKTKVLPFIENPDGHEEDFALYKNWYKKLHNVYPKIG